VVFADITPGIGSEEETLQKVLEVLEVLWVLRVLGVLRVSGVRVLEFSPNS
jgi:hypothetical protein